MIKPTGEELEIVRLEKQVLARRGCHVEKHTGSVAAFGAKWRAVDLVLTGMTMSDMTGIAISEEVISIRPDILIIICTGFSEKISEELANVPLKSNRGRNGHDDSHICLSLHPMGLPDL